MVLTIIPDYNGFLLAIMPPGAFIGLASLIATRNWLEQRKLARLANAAPVLAH
jgi:electron transport complex protein RnfE